MTTTRLLILAPFFALASCCPPFCPTPPTAGGGDIATAVHNLGYVPLQNPDNNFARGAIIAVTSNNPFNGDIVCSADQVLGGIALLPVVGGIASAWQSSTQGSLTVDASVVQKINAKLGTQAVQSITASLSNTSVGDLRDTDVVQAASKPVSAFCIQAIHFRQQNNPQQPIILISSSLTADASYQIQWSASVSAQAQAQLTPQISGDIAANLQTTNSGTLTGKGLVYGVHDNTTLLQEYVQNVKQPVAIGAIQQVLGEFAAQTSRLGPSVLKTP